MLSPKHVPPMPRVPARTAFAALLLAVVALSADAHQAAAQDDPRSRLVVDAAWLQANLDDPNVLVLHVGQNYAEAHIPGAVPVDLGAISVTTGDPDGPDYRRLELPDDLGSARSAFEAAGVSSGSTVVAVFEGSGVANATRAIWTLQVLGKDDARLLDGGLDAWTAAGGAVATGDAPLVERGVLDTPDRLDRRVDRDFVLAEGDAPGIALLDGRRPQHYTGEREERPGRAGHIPGAASVPLLSLFTDDGRLRPEGELRDLFTQAGVAEGDRVVTYCHIGFWASGVAFVARTLGFDARLYDGSMNEWALDPELPLVAGGG
ncbi:MAG: sulfurtransferase [Gemmatimonadetes bacterium]|nr:sulfurtransferase [Gemmatimonadota bacterium]